MAFEKGNKLGAKGKLFDGALKRAIAQDDGVRLREAAEQLLTLAAAGEQWAVKELADRLDGKATQVIDAVVSKRAQELTDDELADIALGSGEGATGPAQSAGQPTGIH